MKSFWGVCVTMAAAAFAVPGMAEAQPLLQQRCNVDSLDSPQAEARLAWARRCALVNHLPSTSSYFDTGALASNGGYLYEYSEYESQAGEPGYNGSGLNAYTGHGEAYEVNSAVLKYLYLSGGTSQDVDGDGYYRWSRPVARKKARPQYPTFGSNTDIEASSNVQLFPHPTLANCTLYRDRNGTQPAPAPGSFFINGYCVASCYTPEQKVAFAGGAEAILDAVKSRREDVITLTPDSSLDDIQLKQGRTYSYSAEFRDSEHTILQIKTASGGQLRVTVDHPVVNDTGRLVAAEQLKVGEGLLKADGTADPIVDISRSQYFGKVYNLRPDTDDRVSNLLLAEGFVVGSSLFQNDEVNYVNRVILYGKTPASLMP